MNSNYICYYIVGTYKLAAPRKPFLCPSFVQYDTRLLRQKAVWACLHMLYNGSDLPVLKSYPPPPKLAFP